MSLGTLTVDLVMKTGKFESDTKRAEKRAKQMAKDIDASVSKVGTALASAAAIGFGAFALGVKSAVDAADEMGKVAQKIGVSVEALSALSFAASQSEVDLGQLQKALAKIAVDIAAGGGEFQKLGITATTADQALLQLADKFAAMPDGINKTAAAAKIFGERIGPDLIPLLNLGRSGIEDLTDTARELGLVISTETARNADAFNDSMDQVKAAMQGAFLKVANDLLPEMQRFAIYLSSAEFQNGIGAVVSGLASIIEFAGKGIVAIGGLGNALADVFRADTDKTTLGLLTKRAAIEADLQRSPASLIAGGESGEAGVGIRARADVQKDLKAALARVDAEINARRNAGKAAGVFASISDTSVNPNPYGRKGNGLEAVLGSSGASASSRASTASREKAEADREAEEAARRLAEAGETLNSVLDRQAAEIGGPLVQAAQDYRDQMVELDRVEKEYADQGKLTGDVVEQLNLARERATQLYQDETAAIQDQKTPAEDELIRLRNELELLGLTNEERAKRAFLLNNPGATDEQAAEASGLVASIEQAAKAQQAMDAFRSSAADAFEGFLTGSMSAADAFESFADSVVSQIARILAQQAIESLFGGFGGSGGGSFGGGIAGFFGSLFGGGRANGGAVSPGRYYRVNENGPEMLTYQGKDFLMMGQGAGMVHSNSGGSNITVNVSPTTDRRTAQQVAQRIAEKGNMAMARNK